MANEMASASGRQARVQFMASSARMAAARGLGGQSTDDARPPRGGNFLNPVGTVASELSIQLLGGPTDRRH